MITAALLISSFIYATAGEECIPSVGRGVGTIPPYCPDDHPDLDAGLCYKNCKTGYYAVGPVCWEECNGIDRGALCETQSLSTRAKHSYGRGKGVIPTDCGNKQKDAGLCYDYCPSGYYPVGPVCWEHCASGYRDDGASCFKNIFDFYFKKTKGRTGTIPSSCASGFENDAGLCYKKCNSGYDGIGPVCWEVCKSGEVDDGAFCRIPLITITKDSYGRGVGLPKSKCEDGKENDAGLCYKYCGAHFDGVGPVCWNENFGTAFAVVASTAPLVIPLSTTCSLDVIYASIINAPSFSNLFNTDFHKLDLCLLDNLVAGIDESWDPSQTAIGFEVSISASIGGGIFGYIANKDNFPDFNSAPDFANFVRDTKKDDFSDAQIADFLNDFLIFWYNNFFVNRDGINIYIGLAFKVGDNGMDVYWYYGTCNTLAVEVAGAGIQFTTIVHKSVEDIAGESTYFQLGASTPFAEVGVGVAYWINSVCQVTSVGSYLSAGAGVIPFVQIEGGQCNTANVMKITNTLTPTTSPTTTSPTTSPTTRFKVLSVDHKAGADGMYFNFYAAAVNMLLGRTDWNSDRLWVFNHRTQTNYKVAIWSNNNGGSIGDAHGRKDPKELAQPNDWVVGDELEFVASPQMQLKSALSGKCLDIEGTSLKDGANVYMWDCHDKNNQKWYYDSSTRQIKSVLNDKCLDVFHKNTEDGANVHMWTCHDSESGGIISQQWILKNDGTIVGVQSNKCLDIFHKSTETGANIHIWTCKDTESQIFNKL